MKTLVLARFTLSAAASLVSFGAQSPNDSSREIVGRLPAEPDVVLDWNTALSDHFEEFSFASTLHIQARVYALLHLAMRDAIAAATREVRHDAGGAVAKAAANAAAHDILIALRPAGANRFAALRARHGAANTHQGAEARGREIGRRVAVSVLRSRAGDGWPTALSRSSADQTDSRSRRAAVVKPAPFVLKRVYQFEPEPPVFIRSDDLVLPNYGLQNKKLIGTPADVVLAISTADLWRTEPVVRWNRAAQSLATQQSQDLSVRARVFALLNTALADALLSATYWNDAYRSGRVGSAILAAVDAYQHAIDAREMLPNPVGQSWVTRMLPGFPAIPAGLAGAAETILRSSFGDDDAFALPVKSTDTPAPDDFTSLRTAARQCAWAALLEGASTPEACIAGYDLGSRIARHVLKQDQR